MPNKELLTPGRRITFTKCYWGGEEAEEREGVVSANQENGLQETVTVEINPNCSCDDCLRDVYLEDVLTIDN